MAKVRGFEERYCAFLDVLGFANFIRSMSLVSDNERRRRVRAAEELFERFELERKEPRLKELKIELTYFSDSVFLSGPIEGRDALGSFIWLVRRLATACLIRGFLVRGAVVRGQICHHGSVVFGPAIIRAYELEHTHVNFPRIILDRSVRKEVDRLNGPADQCILSEDGPMSINTLQTFQDVAKRTHDGNWNNLKTGEYKEKMKHLSKVYDFLEVGLESNRDTPHIFLKFKWFAEYFDRTVIAIGNKRLRGWPRSLL